VERLGGYRLFGEYSSLEEALGAIYPDYPWQGNHFVSSRARHGYWHDNNNLIHAVDSIEKQLGIEKVPLSLSLYASINS